MDRMKNVFYPVHPTILLFFFVQYRGTEDRTLNLTFVSY